MLFVSRRVGDEYMHIFENKLSLKKTEERRSDIAKKLSIRDLTPLRPDFLPCFAPH